MAIASKLGQVHAGAVIWASNASPDVIEGHVLIPGNYIYICSGTRDLAINRLTTHTYIMH